MPDLIYNLLDLSEVWALLMPLIFIFPLRKLAGWQKPVAVYVILALVLNSIATLISNSDDFHSLIRVKSNVIFYNIHSVVRFVCFSYFFILLKQKRYTLLKKLLPILYVIMFLINFLFFDNFFYTGSISGNLLTIESYLLLVYCMLFFLAGLKEDEAIMDKGPELWIIVGLSIYVVINFFLFLFYVPMIKENQKLADNMWTVHNVAYIILCIFIAIAFYRSNKQKHNATE
ncbi:MAG: hypothetical protein ABI594_01055 [Ginsengibacter sp.]